MSGRAPRGAPRRAAACGALSLLVAAAALAQTPATHPVTVVATATGLTVPAQIPAGPVLFTFTNRARRVVGAQLLAVLGGHSADEAARLLVGGGQPPPWILPAGGVGPLAPGLSAGVLQTVAAGTYVIASMLPDSDGVAQFQRGYVVGLRAAGQARFAQGGADAVAVLRVGRAFVFQRLAVQNGRRVELQSRMRSAPIRPGDRVIEVDTRSSAPHEFALVKMDQSVQLRRWPQWIAGGQRGPAPGIAAGGAAMSPPTALFWLKVHLEPGTYWLLCTAIHSSGRRGFETGEYAQFLVR